jgi:hypothetical protein
MKRALVVGITIYLLTFWLTQPVIASCAIEQASSCPAGKVKCKTFSRRIGKAPPKTYVSCCDLISECSTAPTPYYSRTTDDTSAVSAEDTPCEYIAQNDKQLSCTQCAATNGVWTAIGCIQTDPNNLLGKILTLGIGLAGGIAFLLILFGGLGIMTSAGNPERLTASRELITSAVIGLMLILFAVFLLKLIGVNILGIPGWG